MSYAAYLHSPWWQFIRQQVRERSWGECEQCHDRPATAVHHLTYERIGCEFPEDVMAICRECHCAAHGLPPPRKLILGTRWRDLGEIDDRIVQHVTQCRWSPMTYNREATDEERFRAVERWRELRRQMAPDQKPGRLSPEAERAAAQAKLKDLAETIWKEPVIIGRGLAAKVPGWLERLEAEERARREECT